MKASARKRVLMLLQNCSYPRDDRVRREARALTAGGYQVSVIARRAPGQRRVETLEGVRVYRFPAPPSADGFLGYVWEYGYSMVAIFLLCGWVLVCKGFDVVHAHHPPDTFAFIGAFFKLLGKRYVLDHHDLAPELYYARFGGKGNRSVHNALIMLERLSCHFADHVLATNQSYKAVEMQRDRVPERRITIVRNGPDLNELCCSDSEQVARTDRKIVLGYVGVMGTQDGVDYLLRALKHLICNLGRSDFDCILLGSGNAFARLKSLAQQLDLADHVLFTGWVNQQSEVAGYISSMDICIAPEPSDPYNDRSTAAKVMEYMALGKPVVAFDLPEHRYTAQDAAVYAHPNDEADMARKIAWLMDDPQRRLIMGQTGRHRIESELAWEHQAEYLLQVYESLGLHQMR